MEKIASLKYCLRFKILLRELELQSFCLKFECEAVLSYIEDTAKMHTSSLPLEKRLLSGLSAGYSKN